MIKQLSKFKCPKCGNEVEILSGTPLCANCGVIMEEVRKGVITKDANSNSPKSKDETENLLGGKAE